ncbi:MAG: hypothetical protein JSS78_10075 [Bacteroidetes bacterium]|nr:hypothetical protein [Bacteroidota bacterium]
MTKSIFSSIAFCLFALPNVFAQKPQTDCVDAAIQAQAQGLKEKYAKQGLNLFQEGMFKMQSNEPIPVGVKLIAGVSYQLIYVGSENSNKMTMEIYDGKDKKLDEKIERATSNIIYPFTPTKTDVYLVMLYQKKGLKNFCGYFGVMAKGPVPAVATPIKKVTTPPAQTKVVPHKTTPTKATPAAIKSTPQATQPANNYPDNQRPNPNRTRATREAQQQKGQLK